MSGWILEPDCLRGSQGLTAYQMCDFDRVLSVHQVFHLENADTHCTYHEDQLKGLNTLMCL